MADANLRRGYLLGIAAYLIWGLFPLYFKQLQSIPASEIVVHRLLGSALFGVLLLQIWQHRGWWQSLLEHPKRFLALCVSGALIASNWLLYVWAVNNGHMLEASLGYYINPLMNIVLGLVLLGERLRPWQWLAVLLAFVGVLQQLILLGTLPWVSLALAATFAFYGLIRKKTPVAALPGLMVETWLLLPIAVGWLWLHPEAISSQSAFWSTREALWLLAAGPLTLIPLIFFNAAAKHLPYTALGFLQYLAPTMVLLLAVFIYDEALHGARLLAFMFIWAALIVYSVDAIRSRR